jgi:ElaB/YqjD/DUF883 family membrane-anchored ribosome-binding protein
MIEQAGDNRTGALPEGTDTVIQGAAGSSDGTVSVGDTALVTEREIPAPRADAERPVSGSGSPEGGLAGSGSGGSSGASGTSGGGSGGSLADRFRTGREQFASQAGERTRGLVGQGLERTSEALGNVARMVGDTASGIEERLGPEYGDYARRAASAIESVANNIAGKDPDELIDDTRTFVRNSPGVALAGAAVVGFVVARLIKSGIAPESGGANGGGNEA